LRPETSQIAESKFVNDADQAIKLKKRVLERSCGQQKFLMSGERLFDGVRNLVAGFVDIPEPVSFVYHNEIPMRCPQVGLFGTGKLERANDDLWLLERI
jgi:hypothetical protein